MPLLIPSVEERRLINDYGLNVSSSLVSSLRDSKSAVYLDSCAHHGFYTQFPLIVDSNGVTPNEAFFIWYKEITINKGTEKINFAYPKVFHQSEKYLCRLCCP
jgi:hypothetical protein